MEKVRLWFWCAETGRGRPLFIGRSGVRRRTVRLGSCARCAASHHLPPKIARMLSLHMPSKDTSDDGSPVDGPRTIAGKEGYRAKNAPMAHLGPGVQILFRRWVHSRSGAPLERGVESDGPTSGQYLRERASRASQPTFESWSVPSLLFFLEER